MLAVAAAETGRAAKGKSPVAAAAAAAAPKRREPTPDHPPYSWMIGEAIEALDDDGGSAEAAISGFIRGKYPGVPASHDKFLRYYLAKHVAEGLFVRTAPGRYLRPPDEPVLALAGVKPAVAPSVGSPGTEAKRGRGRPRKYGSPAAPAGNESGSKSPSATPKRRGRPRKLQLVPTTDVTDRKDGSEAPSTTDKNHGKSWELAPVIANDSYTTPSVVENDDGEAPSAKLVAKDDSAAAFTTPELVPVPAHSFASVSVADKTDGTEAPFVQYTRRRRPCKSAPVKKVDGKSVSATPKGRGRQPKPALVAAIVAGSTPTIVLSKQDSNEAPSTTDENHGQQRELALVIANDSDATPFFVENDGGEAPASRLAVMSKEDAASTLTMPQRSTQPCKLVSVPPDGGSAPVSVADKTDGTEALSTMHKRLRRACRSAPVNAAHGSAPKSTADKVGGKVVSATPKGRGRQHKPALMASAHDSTPTLVAGKNGGNEAQPVPVKPRAQPRKLFLLTADEIPDDPMFCLLALPAEMPAITMA